MSRSYIVRTAEISDLPAIAEIYNEEIRSGTATFDLRARRFPEWKRWFSHHNIDNHPLVVAEAEGLVVGYASLSSYRDKEAYNSTVELSVYVAKDHRESGAASALMEALISHARRDPATHLIVSVITGGNTASVRLHRKFGFSYCGTIHEAGIKFGQYLDIDHYELKV